VKIIKTSNYHRKIAIQLYEFDSVLVTKENEDLPVKIFYEYAPSIDRLYTKRGKDAPAEIFIYSIINKRDGAEIIDLVGERDLEVFESQAWRDLPKQGVRIKRQEPLEIEQKEPILGDSERK
tara:strand:- start:1370 stop:1735 length:366 start_codon:yes stop_codon:yes gene_type:complete